MAAQIAKIIISIYVSCAKQVNDIYYLHKKVGKLRLFHAVNKDENAFNWRLRTKRNWNEGEHNFLSMILNTVIKILDPFF